MSRAPIHVGIPDVRVEAPAILESLPFLSNVVDLYLTDGVGLSRESPTAVQLRLAIVEVMTNVVRHGYKNSEPGPVIVEMRGEDDGLTVVVSDQAGRFDPFAKGGAEIPRAETLSEGGYGLGIIWRVMDSVKHEYDPEGGNRLVLKKKLAS